MSHNLKYNDYIERVTNKLKKRMYVFKNLTNISELKKIKIQYQALIESKLVIVFLYGEEHMNLF